MSGYRWFQEPVDRAGTRPRSTTWPEPSATTNVSWLTGSGAINVARLASCGR